ncbi:MAG: hypothetical protein Q9M30_09745 [Mariprofundaceae bacterium]|nr:hypothetical protein [Mariprofundaceae bacterium]
MGICVGLIWMVRREAIYGWFALGSLFWAIYASWFFVQTIPMSFASWVALTNSCGIWMIGVMWVFVGTYAGLAIRNVTRSIIAYCALVTMVLFMLPQQYLFDGLVIAYLIPIIPCGWILMLFYKYSVKHPVPNSAMLFISIAPVVGLGTADWFNLAFHLQHPYLMHYSAPFIFLLMGWMLLRRFIAAIDEADNLNVELESRVSLREQELASAFKTISTLEKEKALKAERERIMRDIHDGVGGQLVSALAMMENDKNANSVLADTLIFALDDLRLIIDSLAPEEEGLPALLTMFKYRYEPKLKKYGISLNWMQSDRPVLSEFSPQDSLQLLRMMQEAFTNILKHAGASCIDVLIGPGDDAEGDTVLISISDNGKGFPTERPPGGRGLSNMQRRANDIGLEVAFTNRNKGACVRILLPHRAS